MRPDPPKNRTNDNALKMAKTKEPKINPQQLQFCENVADGFCYTTAYSMAYPKCALLSAPSKASRLVTNGNVWKKIKQLRRHVETRNILERKMKREILAGVMMDGSLPLTERLSAMNLDNKMAGHYAPDKLLLGASATMSDILDRVRNAADE